jgi:hypothetical protein
MFGMVKADPAADNFRVTPQSTEHRGSVPGRKWYAVAVLVFLAGMAAPAIFLIAALIGDDFVHVTVPGQAELPLDPGPYTIFHEQGGMTNGTVGGIIIADDVTGLRISVQKPGTGTPVPLTAFAGSRYTRDGRSGQSLFTFTLTEPGTYRLVATYDDGRPGPQAVLAIARDFMGNVRKTISVSWAIGLGSLVIALATGIYVHRRRRSALGPPIQDVSIWRIILAINLDLLTAALLGVGIDWGLTGLLAAGGFSLSVWPSLLWLAVIVGYFVLSHWQFGGTPWQHILKTRRRPGMAT